MNYSTEKWMMIVTPILLPISMYLIFQFLDGILSYPLGYLTAFLIYMIFWCTLFPIYLLGPQGFVGLFAETAQKLGPNPGKTMIALLWPIPFPLFFVFIPRISKANLSIIIASILLGISIGITEEVLWRGVYIRVFPDDLWWGYLYPALGFAIWHLAPQSVLTSSLPGGALSFVLYAFVLGLGWGYYAYVSDSILWCTVIHIIHDILGLGGFAYANWLIHT